MEDRHGEHPPNPAEDDELCAMFDGRGSSQCTIVLPAECLGYGLVVPFLAYRFLLYYRPLVSNNEDLNSLNSLTLVYNVQGHVLACSGPRCTCASCIVLNRSTAKRVLTVQRLNGLCNRAPCNSNSFVLLHRGEIYDQPSLCSRTIENFLRLVFCMALFFGVAPYTLLHYIAALHSCIT